jgi:hypothetical protein
MATLLFRGRSLQVATLYRITIIILHYWVEASLNESDIIVALANYFASFNGNHARASCPGAAPKHRVGAFSSLAARRLRSRSLPVRSASHHIAPWLKLEFWRRALRLMGVSGLMLDPLITAEIQNVRLKLVAFTDRQSDETVRSQCLAVDARLAEVLEGDDQTLRQVLANSVPYVGRRARRSKRLLSIFLQGFRRGSLSA